MLNKQDDNLKHKKMRAVLFARVSTREQAEEGYSLIAQEKLLLEYASNKKIQIQKKFSVPESASGSQERKLFNTMVGYVKEHKEVNVILCEKVDRITRNFKDAVTLDDWLNEDETREIHFVKQSLLIHKNAPSNQKFMWDIYLATARQYSNNLSEETKKGLLAKAEEGWFPGNKKRGYKSVGETGHKYWMVDEDIKDHYFIGLAFSLYDTGNYTLRTLRNELSSQGWVNNNKPAIAISELHRLLQDPFYCGEFVFSGRHFTKAKHQGIISKELFYRVQERLTRKTKAGKYLKHCYLFGGGFVLCGECGRTITVDTKKNHNYCHCTRYKGNCTQKKYVREELMEEQVLSTLDKFKIDNPKILDWVRKALKEINKGEKDYHTEIMDDLNKKRKKVEKNLDQIYEDRLESIISKEFYKRKQEELENELDAIVSMIEKHTKANINYQKLGINLFELCQKGREIYEKKALMNEKRELLQFLFSNLYLKDGKVEYKAHNGFEVIAKRAEDNNWLRDLDSNQNNILQRDVSYH